MLTVSVIMKTAVQFFLLSTLPVSPLLATDCYERGVDYIGTNINDGLETHTASAAGGQVHCQVTGGCQHFSWVDQNYGAEEYRTTCWMKADVTGR